MSGSTYSSLPFLPTPFNISEIGIAMSDVKLDDGLIKGDNVQAVLQSAMNAGEGLLRLTPTWVPRSFLHPGRRIKLHPSDYYRFGYAILGFTLDNVENGTIPSSKRLKGCRLSAHTTVFQYLENKESGF